MALFWLPVSQVGSSPFDSTQPLLDSLVFWGVGRQTVCVIRSAGLEEALETQVERNGNEGQCLNGSGITQLPPVCEVLHSKASQKIASMSLRLKIIHCPQKSSFMFLQFLIFIQFPVLRKQCTLLSTVCSVKVYR